MGKNSYKKFSLFHCILELDRIDFYFRAKLQIEILPMLSVQLIWSNPLCFLRRFKIWLLVGVPMNYIGRTPLPHRTKIITIF